MDRLRDSTGPKLEAAADQLISCQNGTGAGQQISHPISVLESSTVWLTAGVVLGRLLPDFERRDWDL